MTQQAKERDRFNRSDWRDCLSTFYVNKMKWAETNVFNWSRTGISGSQLTSPTRYA